MLKKIVLSLSVLVVSTGCTYANEGRPTQTQVSSCSAIDGDYEGIIPSNSAPYISMPTKIDAVLSGGKAKISFSGGGNPGTVVWTHGFQCSRNEISVPFSDNVGMAGLVKIKNMHGTLSIEFKDVSNKHAMFNRIWFYPQSELLLKRIGPPSNIEYP